MTTETQPEGEQRTAYEQLSPRLRKFVDVIVSGKTQSDAARATGYGKKRPDIAGSKLMARPMVRKAVEQRREQAAIEAGVEKTAVLKRIAGHATNPKAKIADRLRADQLLGMHLKLFTEKHEHAGANGAPLPPPASSAAPVILMTAEAAKAIAAELKDSV